MSWKIQLSDMSQTILMSQNIQPPVVMIHFITLALVQAFRLSFVWTTCFRTFRLLVASLLRKCWFIEAWQKVKIKKAVLHLGLFMTCLFLTHCFIFDSFLKHFLVPCYAIFKWAVALDQPICSNSLSQTNSLQSGHYYIKSVV